VDLDHDLDVDPHLELDGDVDVDPIVDLDLDPRSSFLDEETAQSRGSTCNVNEGVDVYGHVERQGLATTSTSRSTPSDSVAGL